MVTTAEMPGKRARTNSNSSACMLSESCASLTPSTTTLPKFESEYVLTNFSFDSESNIHSLHFSEHMVAERKSAHSTSTSIEPSNVDIQFSHSQLKSYMMLLCKQTHSPELKLKCISRLIVLLSNLLKNDSRKCRRVKKSNPALQAAFSIGSELSPMGGIGWEILKLVGFTECKGITGIDEYELLPQNEDVHCVARTLLDLKYWKLVAALKLRTEFERAGLSNLVKNAKERILKLSLYG